MRDIKFRAWDGKTLFEIPSLYWFEEEGITEIKDGKAIALFGDEYDVVQYTGLKDKNGVEIYEGYVVYDELLRRSKTVTDLMVAHWLIDIDKMNNPMSRVEVIGNIYENPELLEK